MPPMSEGGSGAVRVLQSFPSPHRRLADLHHGLAPGGRRGRGRRRRARHDRVGPPPAPGWRDGPPDAGRRLAAGAVPRGRPRSRARRARPHRGAQPPAARLVDRRRARVAAGRAGDAEGRAPARHPDRPRACQRPHPLRLRGRPRRVRAPRRRAARGPRARLRRRGPAPRGGRVRARRPAAVPVGLRRAHVPGRGLRPVPARPPPVRLRPRVVQPGAGRPRPAEAAHRAVRRRRGRAQGHPLRARGLAALAGLAVREAADRRRVRAGVRGQARAAARAPRAWRRSATGPTSPS